MILVPLPIFCTDTTKDATDSRKLESVISSSFRTCDGSNGFRCMSALDALISAAEAVNPIWSDDVSSVCISDDVIVCSDDVNFFFGNRLKHLLAASISPFEMK